QDDGGRVELGHDRGAGEAAPRLQLRAVVDPGRQTPALEDDLVRVDHGARGAVGADLALRQLRLRRGAEADGTQVHDLAPRLVHAEAVELLVERVEARVELRQAVRAELTGVDRDGDL